MFAGHPAQLPLESTSHVQLPPEFAKVSEFVKRAQSGKILSEDVDRFVTESRLSLELTHETLPSLSNRMNVDQLLVGVTPELYDVSVRALTALDSVSDGAADRAIEAVSTNAPFWPNDLRPREVPSRDRDRRAALLARVVVHADRCGLLVSLLDHASENDQRGQLRSLAQLARRYEDGRRFSQRPGNPIPS